MAVVCECCLAHIVPEPIGSHFRCENCRCAITARGKRFRDDSELKPTWPYRSAPLREIWTVANDSPDLGEDEYDSSDPAESV